MLRRDRRNGQRSGRRVGWRRPGGIREASRERDAEGLRFRWFRFSLRSGRQRHLPGGELDGDETGWSWSWGTFSGTRRGDRSQTGQSLTEVAG